MTDDQDIKALLQNFSSRKYVYVIMFMGSSVEERQNNVLSQIELLRAG